MVKIERMLPKEIYSLLWKGSKFLQLKGFFFSFQIKGTGVGVEEDDKESEEG